MQGEATTAATRRIPLKQRGQIAAYALIDAEDYDALARWSWALNDKGYAQRSTTVRGKRINHRMHREILGLVAGDGLEVDHINGDPLDNRRANLRIVTHAENHQNRHTTWGSSRFRGVSWCAAKGKWRAEGRINGRGYHLGYFAGEKEAAAVAAAWRAEHMPFARG